MKLKTKLTEIKAGVILSYIGMGISIVGALFISNRVLDYIGDYNYGLYSFVNSITAWLTIISSALTASFLRYATLSEKENKLSSINTIYLKMLSILGIIIVAIGVTLVGILYYLKCNFLSYNWEDSKLLYLMFLISIVNIGITMPTNIFSLYINYRKKFIFAREFSILITIINFAGHFLIAYYTKNIIYIAAFSILVTIITFLGNYIFCYRKLSIDFKKTSIRDNKPLIKTIMVFSGILLFNAIVDQINTNIDKTLLGVFSTPEKVTIYQMAQQIVGYLTLMSVAVSGVFAPSIHENVAKNDQIALNHIYLKVSKVQILVLCCVAFGFLACGKYFIKWWIGDARIQTYYVCAALMILNLGPLTMNASIEIQRAQNKHKFRAITYFILAITNIMLSIMFLKILPSEYAVYACLFGTIITTIISHWVSMNIYNAKVIKLPIKPYILNLLLYMLLGLIGFIVVFWLSKMFINRIALDLIVFLIQGAIFVMVYACGVILLNYKIVLQKIKQRKTIKDNN